MKVYVPKYSGGAGRPIYNGYFNAWNSLGYDVEFYDSLESIKPCKDYYLMLTDSQVNNKTLDLINKSNKSFVFVQPNRFPKHWGTHPNFVTSCNQETIQNLINSNSVLWTFSNTKYSKEYYYGWNVDGKSIIPKYIPLAFDDIHYKPKVTKNKTELCFVGGIANNGFNEKINIMLSYLKPLMNKKYNGIFVGVNIPDELEIELLSNAKIALNIHDAYQQELGFDVNERTFKSLGLNGCLVSDHVEELTRLFNIDGCKNPQEYLDKVEYLLSLDNLEEIKNKNKELILKKHTYKNRISLLLNNEDYNNSSLL